MQRFVPIEDLFKGRHFDRQIIVLCVSWYTSFKLSLRRSYVSYRRTCANSAGTSRMISAFSLRRIAPLLASTATGYRFNPLSFAKNGSGNMSLRCNAFITMMQTAQLWDLDNPSDS